MSSAEFAHGTVSKTEADTILISFILHFFFFFSRENKTWLFMWIVCLADDSHEMSRLILSEK